MVVRRSEAKHNRLIPPPKWPPQCRLRSEPGRVVDRLPLLPRPVFPGWCRHPLPVALGEVEQLCQVEERASGADLELTSLPRPWPVTIEACPELDASAAFAHVRSAALHLDEALGMLIGSMLDARLKLLRPSQSDGGASSGLDPGKTSRRLFSDAELEVLRGLHR